MTDDLLRKHFIVVGSTGSGKSCALTCILQRLLEVRTTAHVVILDVHNEYSTSALRRPWWSASPSTTSTCRSGC